MTAEDQSRSGKPGRQALPSFSVGVILAPGFTLSAFALFVDTLRLAAEEADVSGRICCRWTVMADASAPVRSSSGVEIYPDSGFVEPAGFDYIVIIGGLLQGARQAGPAIAAYLLRAAASGVTLVGIGSGSFILCEAGLMEGRKVCVSWLHYQDFRIAFPAHAIRGDRLFEIDGDRITCAGGAGAGDLATALIERHLGSRLAQKPRQVLLLPHTRDGNAIQPHPPVAHDVDDEHVRRALLLMEQTLGNPLPIATIAAQLGVSPRQLERRFDAALGERPSQLYRRLRLRYARWLLETTTRSITDIAIETGFSDCAHFSRQFKALHGLPPARARQSARAGIVSEGVAPGRAGPRAF